MTVRCPICGGQTSCRSMRVRSGKELALFHCSSCNFDFFDTDPTALLAANKLDESRLGAAGLAIPDVEKDFSNGLRQSRPYIETYLGPDDSGRNILEIGCSWGYFLTLLQDKGCKPYGVELNAVRARYVNETLGIPCFTVLEACEQQGIQFKQIFLFYVLEYIPDPGRYLTRLLKLLDADGRIVVITPNLADPLKDIWRNQAFGGFFYDECAVNYFTPQAVRNLVKSLPFSGHSIATKQGYSFVNHLSWYLTNAPRTTGMVGGDYYVQNIGNSLESSSNDLGILLARSLKDFDAEYRRLIEQHEYGNQIHVVLER